MSFFYVIVVLVIFMIRGISGVKGILLYETKLDEDNNAVYGYYEDNELNIIKGAYEELRYLQREHDYPYEKENNIMHILMLGQLIVSVIFIILSIIYLPLSYIIATIFFCIATYFPIIGLIYAMIPMYNDKEVMEQFKRFHGAEHAVGLHIDFEKELTIDSIQKEKYFDGECGTAYAQSAIVLTLVICFIIINFINLGFLKSIFMIFITIFILILNIFNRYNPFFLIQSCVVSKPTDKEYILALEIGRTLKEELNKTINNGDKI